MADGSTPEPNKHVRIRNPSTHCCLACVQASSQIKRGLAIFALRSLPLYKPSSDAIYMTRAHPRTPLIANHKASCFPQSTVSSRAESITYVASPPSIRSSSAASAMGNVEAMPSSVAPMDRPKRRRESAVQRGCGPSNPELPTIRTTTEGTIRRYIPSVSCQISANTFLAISLGRLCFRFIKVKLQWPILKILTAFPRQRHP